jgi:hypothetical protein
VAVLDKVSWRGCSLTDLFEFTIMLVMVMVMVMLNDSDGLVTW